MRLFARAGLLVVILLAEFAALEAAMRWYGGTEASPAFQQIFMPDARVGHRPRPNARARYTTAEFATDLAINSQGVRADDDIGPKAPTERRVVILGDSLVMSVQVPLAETFGAEIERGLSAADPAHRWRVINAGVQGYGPVEEWLFYRHFIDALEPDVVVIVAFVANDAVEAFDRASWIDAGGRPDNDVADAATSSVRRLVRSSMVLQAARLRWTQLVARFSSPTTERPLTSYLTDPPVEVTKGLDVARRAFGLIAERATARGARTAIVLMPARFQTDDADYARLKAIVSDAGGTLVRDAATERFRAALAPLALPTLDLLPVLSAQTNRVDLFFQQNVHLTPRGHRVVGDAVLDFLEKSGLTSRTPR